MGMAESDTAEGGGATRAWPWSEIAMIAEIANGSN